MAEGRLPFLRPEELDAAQRDFYDDVVENMGSPDLPHVWRLPEGQLNGPFTAMLHFPENGRALYNLQRKIVKQGIISKDIAELVILVVVCGAQVAYGVYAHDLLARGTALAPEKVDALVAGRYPPGLTGEERAAYDLATALGRPGPLPGEVYSEALACFGAEGLNTLVYTVGLFKFLGTIMNAYDEPAPE